MSMLLWPEGRAIPPQHIAPENMLQDLQLEAICDAMAFNHYFRLTAQDLMKLWTDDPAVIRCRQQVLTDFMEHPELSDAMENLLDCIDTWESHSGRSGRGGGPGQAPDLWDFSFLESYLSKVESLCSRLSAIPLRSEAMLALRRSLGEACASGRFSEVKALFDRDCDGYSLPSRLTIGFNLNANLKPVAMKLLRVPAKPREKGRRISLTPSAMLTAGEVAASAAQEAGQAISMFVRQESAFLRGLKMDIIFYLSALKLRESWNARGLKSCIPEICPADDARFTAEDMFDPLLVVHGSEKIISNSIDFRPGGELLILTGANQGGKTVFLLSAALTQWLFQLGIMVPCASASLSPVRQILTVFAPNAEEMRNQGLLAEETKRIADAVSRVTPGSMVLLNEPLNATSPAENLRISREVLAVLKAAGARGVWVTHMYELADDRERINALLPWGSTIGSIRIVVETDEAGTHSTYHITRGEPEYKSYAIEVMRRQGISGGLLEL